MEEQAINILQYVRPELLIVVVAMYIVGMSLKKTSIIQDKYIPITLGTISVFMCFLFFIGNSEVKSVSDMTAILFTALTQGVIIAACPTYVNQLIKQMKKQEDNTK